MLLQNVSERKLKQHKITPPRHLARALLLKRVTKGYFRQQMDSKIIEPNDLLN